MLHRLGAGVGRLPRQHQDHDLGAEPGQRSPADLGRLQPGWAGDVLAAGDRDHLRHPEAGDAGWVEPLQGDHPRLGRGGDGRPHGGDPSLQLSPQLVGLGSGVVRLSPVDQLFEHLAERCDVH